MSDSPYLRGERLYGDDFTSAQIANWWEDEKEAYAKLGSEDRGSYTYAYHALNIRHGFRHLPPKTFSAVLDFGGAYGDEIAPIANRIEHLTVVDPSDAFENTSVMGIPTRYVKPTSTGELPFGNGQFDLLLCLDVLHHIPNVSKVLRELRRVLAPSGYALLREPVVSLGDWTQPRKGLTARERGIPANILRDIVLSAGFRIEHERFCMFLAIPRIVGRVGVQAYNSHVLTWIDDLACRILKFNLKYHATSFFQKFRPTDVFYVLRA